MAIRIVTASGKGGVGKSTVCKGLGLSLASAGYKTLLVDCDAGLSSLDIMLSKTESVNFTWYDVILKSCEASDALTGISENLTLLPSPRSAVSEPLYDEFKELTDELSEQFDYVLLDAPAGIGNGLKRAASAADKGIIIATGDEISVRGAATVANTLFQSGISESRLIINRYDIKAVKKGKLLNIDDIIDKTVVQLIGIIPEDKNIQYSSVCEKKLNTKKSDKAFERIAGRITGNNIELKLSQLK